MVVGSSGRSGSSTGKLLGSVLPSMGTFSVSMTKGENELVQRSSSPDDQDKEDGLDIRRVSKAGTYEVLEDTEEYFFLGCGSVST